MPLSNSQFGSDAPSVETPMALGASTSGTFSQRTAWRNPRGGSTPVPYSKKTAGTTFNWDDSSSTNPLPRSDKGAGRNE
jgi:hypothetical protein